MVIDRMKKISPVTTKSMNKLIYGILLLSVTYVIGWHVLYGQFINEWYKKYQNVLVFLCIPSTYISIYSVKLLSEYFDGKIWPNRIISFSVGIIYFMILSSIYFNEKLTIKTITLLCLSLLIVVLQIIW